VTDPVHNAVFFFEQPFWAATVDFESTANYVHLKNNSPNSASYNYKWGFHIHYSEQAQGTNHWASRVRSDNWPNWITWAAAGNGELFINKTSTSPAPGTLSTTPGTPG